MENQPGPDPADSRSVSSLGLSRTTLDQMREPEALRAIEVAVANTVQILSEDEYFEPLYAAAIVRIGREPFELNFSKLLGSFSKDLSKGAVAADQKGMAWLIFSKRRMIANAIRRQFVPDNEEKKSAMASLEARPTAKAEHLQRFLDERFARFHSNAREDPVELPDLEEEETPDIAIVYVFGSVQHIRTILTRVGPYARFRDRYQLFVSLSQEIASMLDQ